jgi:hypothetical protein
MRRRHLSLITVELLIQGMSLRRMVVVPLVLRVKRILIGSTFRAYPVIGKVLECSSRFHPAVGITNGGIIHVTTHLAHVLLHTVLLCTLK